MICAFCKNEIENDSFFCDQCGEEILICPVCKNPGKGKRCTNDGNKLITARELSSGSQMLTEPSKPEQVTTAQPGQPTRPTVVTPQPAPASPGTSTLKMSNESLGVKIELTNGDIIGRKDGPHKMIFSKFSQISGKHAKITSERGEWLITDLGSSNGTKYGGALIMPNQPQRLFNKTNVILANIEFYIEFDEPPSDDEKTVRI